MKLYSSNRSTPNDNIIYNVPLNCIEYTQKILVEYSKLNSPNEGIVYWAGKREDNAVDVLMVIAPFTESSPLSVKTSNKSNFSVIRLLNANSLKYIGQVHSHPTDWVGHSEGDDENAPFRTENILSLVVPTYCKEGLLPLTKCGLHRYTKGKFIRLSDKYIRKHFKIVGNFKSELIDLRNAN
jgi:JAB domain-containing protein similar to deubiquitination enzymes